MIISKLLVPERIPGILAYLYDKIARTSITDYYTKMADEITSFLIKGIILDIGIGPAYLPIEIAKRNEDIKFDGIDLTKKMIKIAEKNVKDSGLTKRINCFVANGNKLVGFKDNYYDMIISTGALHRWKNPAKVINECYRVLKPGCEAWIFDPALIGSEEKVKLLKGFDMVLLKLLSLIPGEVMIVTYTETEIIKIIKNTKFKRYEIRERKNSVEIKLKK